MAGVRLSVFLCMSVPLSTLSSKALVLFIYLFEFAQTLIATHDAFKALGSGWGDSTALKNPQLAWLSVPMMSGISKFKAFFFIRTTN